MLVESVNLNATLFGIVTVEDVVNVVKAPVEAVQTVLGLNPAGSHLTIKDRIIATEANISIQSVLNGLTDVTINSVTSGQVLRYNGSQWINYAESNLVDGGNF